MCRDLYGVPAGRVEVREGYELLGGANWVLEHTRVLRHSLVGDAAIQHMDTSYSVCNVAYADILSVTQGFKQHAYHDLNANNNLYL